MEYTKKDCRECWNCRTHKGLVRCTERVWVNNAGKEIIKKEYSAQTRKDQDTHFYIRMKGKPFVKRVARTCPYFDSMED